MPEQNEIAVVGIYVFAIQNRHYRAVSYTPYLAPGAPKLPELEKFLHSFPGIVLGHHIFGFDFRVLRNVFPLEGVIEKSVDTLWCLRQRDETAKAQLSLDALARVNFGKGKLLDGGKIPSLWREGHHDAVIRYNKNDCCLTFRLWQSLVVSHQINVFPTLNAQMEGASACNTAIKLNNDDLSALTGQKPAFTYPEWLKAVEEGGKIFNRSMFQSRAKVQFVDDVDLKPDSTQVFNRIKCTKCANSFILVSDQNRVYHLDEVVICPLCSEQTFLGNVERGHWVWRMSTLVHFSLGKLGFLGLGEECQYRLKRCHPSEFPSEEKARKWFSRLPNGWYSFKG